MSINFEHEATPEAIEKMRQAFGEAVASDGRQFLYDNMREIKQTDMKAIANAAKQPAVVELHEQGEIKTMADGTQYEVTPTGWRRRL